MVKVRLAMIIFGANDHTWSIDGLAAAIPSQEMTTIHRNATSVSVANLGGPMWQDALFPLIHHGMYHPERSVAEEKDFRWNTVPSVIGSLGLFFDCLGWYLPGNGAKKLHVPANATGSSVPQLLHRDRLG